MAIVLCGVKIDQITKENALHQCLEWLNQDTGQNSTAKLVFTPNPEILVYAQRNPTFKTILNQADLSLPDGVGVVWASRGAITERVTGADIMQSLLNAISQRNVSIGVVLSKNGLSSPTEVKDALRKRYPTLQVTVTTDSFEQDPELIFIALGSPEQEIWATQHKHNLKKTRLMLVVGGGIDYLTHKQRRAPVFLQSVRLEWLWRLWQQPRRFKRICTAIFIFPYLVIRHPQL